MKGRIMPNSKKQTLTNPASNKYPENQPCHSVFNTKLVAPKVNLTKRTQFQAFLREFKGGNFLFIGIANCRFPSASWDPAGLYTSNMKELKVFA